jgi:hypothetical protein
MKMSPHKKKRNQAPNKKQFYESLSPKRISTFAFSGKQIAKD